MNRRKILLFHVILSFFYLFSFSFFAVGQKTEANSNDEATLNRPFKDRVYFGGNLGFSFGNSTTINVSPLIGYKLSDDLSVGIGGTYIYYKVKAFNYETNIYGGSLFSRYFITDELFAHAEYEVLSFEAIPQFENEIRRITVPALLLGAGYRQRISGRASIVITALFDVIQDSESPYINPIIRGGLVLGI